MSGKLATLDTTQLAEAAIRSVAIAPDGRDGISYLIAARRAGITTPLTEGYAAAILEMSGAGSPDRALAAARSWP